MRDERLIAVAPLDPMGAGVELFDERALAVSESFDPAASRADVEEICRQLDGVPLAIELAAARTRSLSPADLVERLDDRLRLLTGGRRASVERHRTLRATIQWSYDLLTPDEQSVVPAAVDLRRTIRPGGGRGGGRRRVARCGRGRRSVGEPGRPVDGERRVGPVRPPVPAAGDDAPVRGRAALRRRAHRPDRRAALQWCLSSVASARSLLASVDEIEGVARLDELWPNLRAAVSFAVSIGDGPMARSLIEPIMAESYLRARGELGEWCEQILEITPPSDFEMVTWCVVWAARRYMRLMDRDGVLGVGRRPWRARPSR